ncbi:MAG: kinase anchor protein, partial [Halobacteria archaeon]|nr:kinase anchor protein [Halobacteria archaeon]
TIVEDANQHADLLQKLLNVSDERSVKLDKGIRMDVDTLLVVISNPDLDNQLNQGENLGERDPLKALKRRLEKHEFRYLTNYSLETQLLKRELTNETDVWRSENYEEVEKLVRSPLKLKIKRSAKEVIEREIAPHGLEGAAMYNVVSRLDGEDVPAGLDLVEKAVLFDRGYIQDGDDRLEKDDFNFDNDPNDGKQGIPVTYARDIIAELLTEESERSHPELELENVITPNDIVDAMVEKLNDEPMFSDKERKKYRDRVKEAKSYIFEQQESDVLRAIMRDKRVDEESVEEYIEHVYAWAEGEQIENERGQMVDPDPLKMRVFEIEKLGRFSENDYVDNHQPSPRVKEFRRNKIVTAMNRYAWKHRTEDFEMGDIDTKEIPVIRAILGTYEWADVKRTFEDFEPKHWDNPPTRTETENVKEMTIDNMVEMFDYTKESAELTSRHVMEEVSEDW